MGICLQKGIRSTDDSFVLHAKCLNSIYQRTFIFSVSVTVDEKLQKAFERARHNRPVYLGECFS